jgi:hypothetical protein
MGWDACPRICALGEFETFSGKRNGGWFYFYRRGIAGRTPR